MTETGWAAYRLEVFGEPYLVWHDGPDFDEIIRRYAADPASVLAMVAAGIAEDDPVAAQVPRHLVLTDAQRTEVVAMLEAALAGSSGATQTELASSLHALGGSPDLAQHVVDVLRSPAHWGVRLDAARRLAGFPPTPALVAALAEAVGEDEYLVRYHSANTLLRWAGRTEEISDDERLFGLLAEEDAPDGWAAVATELAAAVPLPP